VKLDVKPAAILLVTLALGAVLGMVGRGQLTRERDRRVAELRTAPGFVSLVQEVIEPRAEQVDSIRPILAASAQRYDSLVSGARVGLGLVLDSMKLQLAPLLDASQRERLARMSTLPDANRRPPRQGERPRDDRPPRNDAPRESGPPREGTPPPRGQAPPPPRPGDPPPDRPPPPPPE